MKDTASHNTDAAEIGAVLLIGVCSAAGFSTAASSSQTKDVAIAALQSQVTELRKVNDTCQSEFRGYRDGRR